ncbi:hypothetical protein DPMN_147626 [Dreissena polymorpha]|uniref:Uncharacterized protein n=1 Tax=Dreissena polymorpha TaxID=45954 RepID=A0A9D4F876_DREPO|nr:hypothetical protein DPMN_147626 [Dreissena polymorpha]
MTSVPAVSNVIGEDLEGQRSNSVPKGNEAKHSAVDEDYHIVGEFEHSADMGAVQQSRHDEIEGASVTSRVSNRGQQYQFKIVILPFTLVTTLHTLGSINH